MVGTIQADFSICDTGPNSRGHAVCIQVEDSGAGMDDAVLKNIFSPFFTTRAPGKGTGLGMSVVHAIIQKLGGDIKVSSKVGVGTKINIYIPVIPEQTEHT
jgi:signal transduction histidine kinase